MLVLTRPDVIAGMHDAFFEVGVDVRRDRDLRRVRRAARRVRHRRQGARDQRRGGPASPARSRPATGRRRRLGGGLDRPGHQVRRRSARSASPTSATRTRSQAARPARGRRRPAAHRDAVRPAAAKAAVIGVPAGDGGRRPSSVPIQMQVTIELTGRMLLGTEIGAALVAPRCDEARRLRPQLRDRSARDDRAPPPPLAALAHADLVPPERRPAVGRRRPDALRPHARAARRLPRPVRHRARRAASSAAAAAPRPSTSVRSSSGAAT